MERGGISCLSLLYIRCFFCYFVVVLKITKYVGGNY